MNLPFKHVHTLQIKSVYQYLVKSLTLPPLQGCSFMACHCGCKFDYITGQPYENGIGPAHLFAPEWVDDHIAILAAARQAAAAAQQLAQQHLATAAGLDELQAAIAAHHQA